MATADRYVNIGANIARIAVHNIYNSGLCAKLNRHASVISIVPDRNAPMSRHIKFHEALPKMSKINIAMIQFII